MIVALMMGRAGSKGFKNKNLIRINGKRLFEYPLIAAKKSKLVQDIYITTDCPVIKKVSKSYNVKIIDRPKNLKGDKALGDKVFEHGYFEIKKRLKKKNKKIKYIVLLLANCATVNTSMINKGIQILNKNKKFDSAVSTSIYNMWSPLRARKLKGDGTLKPFIPFKAFGNVKNLNCDRDSQGNVFFADMGVSVIRPKCLENLESGLLPQKWMGKKIAPIYSDAGFDLDFDWQLPLLKFWIKKYARKK
tara:strand:+ start:480 stop:1220 length:741 start_codon:yes stop_codon:yes gene_type:complete